MELADLLRSLAGTLERLGIPYLVVGSVASITYGEPRFTNDIDVVVLLTASQAAALCDAFPEPEYYCSRAAAEDAARRRFQFNILHPESGLKVDVIVATDSPFDRSQMRRGVRLQVTPDCEVVFSSPEDVIVKKLEYFREGGSEKHLRDIVGVLKVQGDRIDRAYLADWIARLGLTEEWRLVESRMGGNAG